MTRARTLRTPDRVARSAIARSGVQREKSPRSGSISLLEELGPGSARRFRHRLSGTRGCAPSSMTNNVTYGKNVIYALARMA